MRRIASHETGAALLTVLILVGVLGAITVASLDRLRLATTLTGNGLGLAQARAFADIAENLVTLRIDDMIAASPGKTSAAIWQGKTAVLPLPIGTARARLRDGGNCFNLNSLATGSAPDALVARPIGIDQFAALMVLLGVAPRAAHHIAAAAADWIDSDAIPSPDGGEDAAYAGAATPYRTANTLMAEPSELRAVSGVTPEIYARLRPWLCALPVAELSPINVNTLTAEKAPLLAMLYPGTLAVAGAQRAIGERPTAGWNTPAEFWNTPSLRSTNAPGDATRQVQVRSQWFALDMAIAVADSAPRETALIDARRPPARIVSRRWTAEE